METFDNPFLIDTKSKPIKRKGVKSTLDSFQDDRPDFYLKRFLCFFVPAPSTTGVCWRRLFRSAISYISRMPGLFGDQGKRYRKRVSRVCIWRYGVIDHCCARQCVFLNLVRTQHRFCLERECFAINRRNTSWMS